MCDWFCFGVCLFLFFFFLSFVTNLYKRLSFLWKDAKRSFNPAPKSPYSAPLQVYTVAFVYKVQDHTFYRVTTMFLVLIWGCKWGFCFWSCFVSYEDDFVAFSSGEKWLLVQSIKILTGSQMSCLLNKWDYLWIYGIFHCVRCNLNRSGADLEIFYNTLGFVWIFFFSLRICFSLTF